MTAVLPIRLLLLIYLLTLGLSLPATARIFTNIKGQEIDATIVAASGGSVVLNVLGKEYTIPVNTLSPEDQIYIKKWSEANPTAVKLDFSFYADLRDLPKEKANYVDSDERLQVYPKEYSISVTSRNATPVKDVRVEYQIFVQDFVRTELNEFRKLAYCGSNREAETQRIKGTKEVSHLDKEGRIDIDHGFTTEKYVDRDYGRIDVAKLDKVMGIWVRVYKGNVVVDEYKDAEATFSIDNLSWEE